MDLLPSDIQYMIIKDLTPDKLLELIQNNADIKKLVKERMNHLIDYYIDEYDYEYYLWEDTETIDDFIENLKIKISIEPTNNDIFYEALRPGWYQPTDIEINEMINNIINKIDDIRHLKMFLILVKKLDIDYEHYFYLNYMDYKDPEDYEQGDANDRIHFMYQLIKKYPRYVELPEDSNEIHIYDFDDIYGLDEEAIQEFYDTVDEYISNGCHPFYVITTYCVNKTAFDYYYLTKKFSPKLSYCITCDFNGNTDVSDEEIKYEYCDGSYSGDADLKEEIEEYLKKKSINKN